MDSNVIGQVELQVLQALGVIVAAGAVALIERGFRWFNIKLDADRQASLESAADKVMTLGVTRAEQEIAAKGWDHPDVKNTVISFAMDRIGSTFQDTLKSSGIDLSNAQSRLKLMGLMERLWPDVATRAAASPVTPASPTPAAAVVAGPQSPV